MKRTTLIVIMLCALMLGTVGAGVVTAKQGVDTQQKGSSPIYKFGVKNDAGTAVVGTLTVNAKQASYVFNAKGLTAGTTYYLKCTSPVYKIASAQAAADGTVHMQGPWDTPVDVTTTQPTFVLTTVALLGGSPIGPVDTFMLHNEGLFVVKISAEYSTDAGAHWLRARSSGDIVLGAEQHVELSALGVPNGALVKMHADVVWGYDKVGSEVFTYVSGSKHWAKYSTWGTTLSNTLKYEKYSVYTNNLRWGRPDYVPVEWCTLAFGFWSIETTATVCDDFDVPVSGVRYEIFDVNTKQILASGTTAPVDGGPINIKLTGLRFITNVPPVMGVRVFGDSNWNGISDTECTRVTKMYPPIS